MEFEDVVNGAFVIQSAEKIKQYCSEHKRCDTCVFWIGCCQLQMHPYDWNLKEVKWKE